MPEDQLEITVENREIINDVKKFLLETRLRPDAIVPPALVLYFMEKVLMNQIDRRVSYPIQEVIARAGLQEHNEDEILGMLKIINGMVLQDRIAEMLTERGFKFLNGEKSTGEELERVKTVLLVIRELISEIK